MAFNVNFRVLLFLLAVVITLNFTQFIMTVRRSDHKKQRHSFPTIAVIDMKAINENPINLSSVANSKREDKVSLRAGGTTVSLDNETCPNTDYLEERPKLELCLNLPAGLGKENETVGDSEDLASKLLMGGFYRNPSCVARQQIAVIVPYSGNKKQLQYFLKHLHYILMKQQAEYQVFVVEFGNKTLSFNRGLLYNVGFTEALKLRLWQCVVLHEPHLILLDSRNLYRCNWYPKQMVTSVIVKDTEQETIGDVIVLNPEQYLKVNGLSNRIVGKDALYSDLYDRFQWSNYTLEKSAPSVGHYSSIGVVPGTGKTEVPYVTTVSPLHLLDGLSSLSYRLENTAYENLSTHIRIRDISLEAPNKSRMLDMLLDRMVQVATDNNAQ